MPRPKKPFDDDFVPLENRQTDYQISNGCGNYGLTCGRGNCARCGFNAIEKARRRELPLVDLRGGRKGKVIPAEWPKS